MTHVRFQVIICYEGVYFKSFLSDTNVSLCIVILDSVILTLKFVWDICLTDFSYFHLSTLRWELLIKRIWLIYRNGECDPHKMLVSIVRLCHVCDQTTKKITHKNNINSIQWSLMSNSRPTTLLDSSASNSASPRNPVLFALFNFWASLIILQNLNKINVYFSKNFWRY